MTKNLIIPLEIQKRELNPAINLVIEALKKNWTVFIGQKQQLFPFIKTLPKSVWYLKSIVPGEHTLIKKIYSSKHLITTMDIEGLIPANIPNAYKQRYSYENIKLVKKIFFWGKWHYENFNRSFKKINKSKLEITGSPVADDWINFSYKEKIKTKKQILIIPSFGFANTETKNLNLNMAFDNLGIKNYDSIKNSKSKFVKNLIDYTELDYEAQKKAYKSFIKLIPKICNKFQNYKIVLRPHPNEDLKMWDNKIKKIKNFSIDNSKDPSLHIKESEAIVHFNSTMSVQSCLMGKKVILYFDINKKYLNVISPVVKKVSKICTKVSDIEKEIRKKNKTNNYKFLKYILKRTTNTQNSACKEIVNTFEKIQSSKAEYFDINKFNSSLKSKFLYHYYNSINDFIVPFLSYFTFIKYFERFSHGEIYRKYNTSRKASFKKKWRDITIKNMRKKILKNIDLNKNLKKHIKVQKHFSGFFIITNSNYKL